MPTRVHKSSRGLNLLVRLTIGFGVISASLVVLMYMLRTKPAPPLTAEGSSGKIVRTIEVRRVPVVRSWTAYGTARPLHEADVAAEVAARVIDRPGTIEPGAKIEKGDLIVQLDDSEFAAEARRARQTIAVLQAEERGLDVDQRTYQENVRLARDNLELLNHELELLQAAAQARGASQIEIDRLKRQITVAQRDEQNLVQRLDRIPVERARLSAQVGVEESNLELAEIKIRRTRILAPISGVLQSVDVREGERVAPGSSIARVTDLSEMEVPLAIPLAAAGSIGQGTGVELFPPSRDDLSWAGEVVRIAPEADPASRTFSVYVVVRQESASSLSTLLPGQFTMARVRAGAPREMVLAPRQAVVDDRVMVVSELGRAESRAVEIAFYLDELHPEIDPSQREWAVVSAGLSDGERVITTNLDELRHGDPITTEASPRPAPESTTASALDGLPIGGNGIDAHDPNRTSGTDR